MYLLLVFGTLLLYSHKRYRSSRNLTCLYADTCPAVVPTGSHPHAYGKAGPIHCYIITVAQGEFAKEVLWQAGFQGPQFPTYNEALPFPIKGRMPLFYALPNPIPFRLSPQATTVVIFRSCLYTFTVHMHPRAPGPQTTHLTPPPYTTMFTRQRLPLCFSGSHAIDTFSLHPQITGAAWGWDRGSWRGCKYLF